MFAVEGAVLHVIGKGSLTARVADCRPNLRDPVTVNALLEQREVWLVLPTQWYTGVFRWQPEDLKHWYPTRTEAIGRAWIAAKGNGNGN